MATDREFKVVGVSCNSGKYKVRYANSASRAKVLANNGHTDIFFIELDVPGTKADCMAALMDYVTQPDCELTDIQRATVLEEAKEYGYTLQEV